MTQPRVKTDIEARVKDTGDIMTGDLIVKNFLQFNKGRIANWDNSGESQFMVQDRNNNGERYISIFDKTRVDNLKNAIQFCEYKDDKYNIYNILTQANFMDYVLPLSGGTMTGTIYCANIVPKTNHTYYLGSDTSELARTYSRVVFARHLDSSKPFGGDYNLYIGYGSGNPTHNTYLYASQYAEDGTTFVRTHVATVHSSGFQVNNCLGVKGLSSSYNFYCNGTSLFSRSLMVFNSSTDPIEIQVKNNNYNGVRLRCDNEGGNIYIHSGNSNTNWWELDSYNGNFRWVSWINSSTHIGGPYINKDTCALYGAVWNDYAEFRDQETSIKPGYCAISQRNGKLLPTSTHLSPCDGVVSDTYGFAIGETDECKTPLAVSGRVLVYVSGDRNSYEIGDCLCAGPGGLAYKMTREEVKEYPDRIIGTVSEIPEYLTWGTGEVEVNNRIWIKVK